LQSNPLALANVYAIIFLNKHAIALFVSAVPYLNKMEKGELPFFIISSLAAMGLCSSQRRLLGGTI